MSEHTQPDRWDGSVALAIARSGGVLVLAALWTAFWGMVVVHHVVVGQLVGAALTTATMVVPVAVAAALGVELPAVPSTG